MNEAAGLFTRRVLSRQAMVGLVAFAAIALLAPKLLLFDASVAIGVLNAGAAIAVLSLVVTALLSALKLRPHRYALRSLALGSRAVDPDDLRTLAAVPRALTLRFFATSAALSTLLVVPGIRPPMLDTERAVSLGILSITILGAAAIPHFMLARAATIRLFELSPEEPIMALLQSEELRRTPERRVTRRLLLATVGPVALVGVGAVLITHAHLRTFIEKSSTATARIVAVSALEPAPGALSEAGRADAVAAAAPFGFAARVVPGPHRAEGSITREQDGQIITGAPLDDGMAYVRFSASLDPSSVWGAAAIALAAVAVAALLGVALGRGLFDDLAVATDSVRLLGTESVLRGEAEIARPARFAAVAELGRAIEVLAERFRVFAAAQERALEARETAQRMRGLLFASVSHDLKSPLNAVLGFAELLTLEDLSEPQRESLELIATRGRELLALIETILDAARVDSGQLALSPRPLEVSIIVTEAVRKALDLASDYRGEIPIEVADALPLVPVDPPHVTRAVAVIIAHALRTAASDPNAGPVRVRATLPASPGKLVRIDVEYGSKTVPPAELDALLARQSSSRGRGLTLGLSLARSIIELHDGAVEVDGAPGGAPVAHCWLPLEEPKPGRRRRLSSQPALG